MKRNYLFTSESVTGRPSGQDRRSSLGRWFFETRCWPRIPNPELPAEDPRHHCSLIVVAGEVTTNARVDYQDIARQAVKRIGYDSLGQRVRLQDLRRDGDAGSPVARYLPGRDRRAGHP